MGRPLRIAVGGLVHHALNRADARLIRFDDDGDDTAFERVPCFVPVTRRTAPPWRPRRPTGNAG